MLVHPPSEGLALEPGGLASPKAHLGQRSRDAQTYQQKSRSTGVLGSPWKVVLAPAQAADLGHGLLLGKVQSIWGEKPPGIAVGESCPMPRSFTHITREIRKTTFAAWEIPDPTVSAGELRGWVNLSTASAGDPSPRQTDRHL